MSIMFREGGQVLGRRVLPQGENVHTAQAAVEICNKLRMWACERNGVCAFVDGARSVISVMRKFGDKEVQIAGMLSLAACVEKLHMREVIVELGGGDVVWRGMKMWESDEVVVKMGLIALRSIEEKAKVADVVKRWGESESIVRNGLALLGNATEEVEVILWGMRLWECGWRNGCIALREICEIVDGCDEVVRRGGIEVIVGIVTRGDEVERREGLRVLDVIGRFAGRFENVRDDVLKPVERILAKGGGDVDVCFRVLRRWGSGKGGEGMMEIGVNYAKSYLKRGATGGALKNICAWLRLRLTEESARREFEAVKNGVETLVECVKCLEEGREHALLALGNATFEGDGKRVRDCEGIAVVINTMQGSAVVIEAGLMCLQAVCGCAESRIEAVRCELPQAVCRVLSKFGSNLPVVERALALLLTLTCEDEGIEALRESGALSLAREAVCRYPLSKTLNVLYTRLEHVLVAKPRRLSRLLSRHISGA